MLEGSRTPIFESTVQSNNRYTTSTVGNEGVEPSQVFLLPDSKSGASQPVAPVTQKIKNPLDFREGSIKIKLIMLFLIYHISNLISIKSSAK